MYFTTKSANIQELNHFCADCIYVRTKESGLPRTCGARNDTNLVTLPQRVAVFFDAAAAGMHTYLIYTNIMNEACGDV